MTFYHFDELNCPHGISFSFIIECDGSALAKELLKIYENIVGDHFYLTSEILVSFFSIPTHLPPPQPAF
jgi:hypothetical protein